jgi:hypothetical protein
MAVAQGDVFLVNAIGAAFGQTIMNTWTYVINTVGAGVDEAAAATEMIRLVSNIGGGGNILETKLLALLPTSYQLVRWTAQKIFPQRFRLVTQGRAVPGTNVGLCNAPNQAAVITRATPLAGRSMQSSLHIGPLPQDALTQTAGNLTFGYQAILANLAGACLTPLAGVTPIFSALAAIYHKGSNPFFTNLSVAFGQLTIRTMRRRTVGLGI